MAKIVDITDKLSFDANPSLVIKGKHLEVNCDAPTVLKIMSFIGDDGVGITQINQAYELIFPEKSRKEIEKLKLNVGDWTIVVQSAMELVIGDNSKEGE